MKVALVGNQNCGKTTLFNILTGANQRVGNFPGVTVDSKVGILKQSKDIEVIDLPGIYSLSPYSNEEIVARDYIIQEHPDIIVNIIDATNIERNLYLTLQLLELGVPMVIALNMMDEVRNSGNAIDVAKLEKSIGVKMVAISAIKDEGITELINNIKKIGKEHQIPCINDFCEAPSPVHRTIHATMNLIEDHCLNKHCPLRYAATRLIEGDKLIEEYLELSNNEKEMLEHIVLEMETDAHLDREAVLAMMRYDFIDRITEHTVIRKNDLTKEQVLSNKIDRILTNKWLAFPIFIIIMALVFYLSFGLIGYYLSSWLEMLLSAITQLINTGLVSYGINEVVRSLVVDGILNGINSVLSFLPTIVVLFFFLSLLEDSGYMARIAFIMDKPLRKIGLSGRSFVPMLIGFGCSVPAVMATRTLTSERDKKLTMLVIPFMSCSAKLPIYTVLTSAFFGVNSVWVMILLYVTGIVTGVLVLALIYAIKKINATPFMMELPSYRLPGWKSTFLLMWEKAKDFIKKAFTVIFVATVIIWFLQSFDLKLNHVANNEDSILAALAALIAPIFKPIGLNDWRLTSALITGLSAKEAVVSTLEVLISGDLAMTMQSTFTSLQGLSLLLFVLLYMPCVATFATMRKELNSTKWALLYVIGQTAFAYFIAFIVYQVGLIIL